MFLRYIVTIFACVSLQIQCLPLDFYALNYYKETSLNPEIKMVIFRTGFETPDQIALMPKIQALAKTYGSHKIEERDMNFGGDTYISIDNKPLQTSWYKIQVTQQIMDTNPQAEWILTFELSALPTDGSAAINFPALIEKNPQTSVFLKRSGLGFGMSMYKNDNDTRKVLENIWEKRSAGSTVAAAFGSYTFWNPLILTKVTFI